MEKRLPLENFSIKCRKMRAKVIKTAHQNERKPVGTQRKTEKLKF